MKHKKAVLLALLSVGAISVGAYAAKSEGGVKAKSEQSVHFDIINNDTGYAEFVNERYEAQGLSDTQAAANILRKQAVLTQLKVEWSGQDTVAAGENIDRSYLKVTALYDDGLDKLLGDAEYSLSREKFPLASGEFTVAVSYTEGGITRTGSFDFTITNGIRTPKQLKVSYTGMQPIEQGAALSAKDFEVTAVYSDGVEKALSNQEQEFFLLSADNVPLQEGPFDVTISLNPQVYGEDELPSVTLTLEADRARIGTWNIGTPNAADVQAVLYEEGDLVFRGSGNTKVFSSGTNVPWYSNRAQVKTVSIENTVRPTRMAYWFYGCSNLIDAPEIPVSVTNMNRTFEGCSNLKGAPIIPKCVTSMYATFSGCSSLTEAPVIPVGVTNMQSTFYKCSNLTETPVIPESVTNMYQTFLGCEELTEAPVIPKGVTDMTKTFEGCSNLKEAPTIPEGVTNMYATFSGCSSLTEAPVIPVGVTNMQSTFYKCSNLTETPVIPESVTNMYQTFLGCEKLTEAPVIPEGVTNMIKSFGGCSNLQGDMIINAIPTDYEGCLSGVATEGNTLYLSGTSTVLNKILATKSSNSQIKIKQ